MRRSISWFKANARQTIFPKGRTMVAMSATIKTSPIKRGEMKEKEKFVVGETIVGGDGRVGI